MKKLSIILVNWNGWDDTIACIRSLDKTTSALCDIEIVLVDNASQKRISSQRRRIKLKNIAIQYIQNTSNIGFTGGNNVGIRAARDAGADYIALLNNDTVVSSDFIDPLIKRLESSSSIGIVGPKIYFASGFEYHADRYTAEEKGNVIWYAGGILDWDNVFASHRGVDDVDIGRYNQAGKTDFVTGCCMLFSTSLIDKIGILDERYFMYLEDVDLCVRAQRDGFDSWYEPLSHIWHKNAQSSGESGSDLHVYYQTRNRLLFGMKFAPLRTKAALLKNSLHVIRANTKRREAVVDFYRGSFGKKSTLHRL